LSILQIFPDWFLSSQLDVLVFPNTGGPFIGTVPLFMAGMWTIPLLLIVYIGRRVPPPYANWAVIAVSAILFLGSEATLWVLPVWYAQHVTQIFHVAIYLIAPEILLGLYTFYAAEWVREKSLGYRLGAAFTVMITYLGNVSLFYLIIEKVVLQ
jgi:hypothetical protein